MGVAGEGQGEQGKVFDEGGGGQFVFEAVAEGGEGGQGAFDVDEDGAGGVADGAGELEFGGKAGDEGAKANALDGADDGELVMI